MNVKWLEIAENLGMQPPLIIQAPMSGGVTSPELVATVSNAAGLGSFATGYLSTLEVTTQIQQIQRLTTKSFSVNLFVPSAVVIDPVQCFAYQKALNKYRHQLGMPEINPEILPEIPENNFNEICEVILSHNIKIVSFTFGILPEYIIKKFQQNNIVLCGTATSFTEATVLADAGIDVIIAQGIQAGGHRGSFLNKLATGIDTLELVKSITNKLSIPVIASGGIMNGQAMANMLHNGAVACQLGTAFLTVQESHANATYKKALLAASRSGTIDTVLTNAYSGKLARGINNKFIQDIERTVRHIPEFPIANTITTPIRRQATQQGNTDIMSMWCGQAAHLVRNHLTAAELIAQLDAELTAVNNS